MLRTLSPTTSPVQIDSPSGLQVQVDANGSSTLAHYGTVRLNEYYVSQRVVLVPQCLPA